MFSSIYRVKNVAARETYGHPKTLYGYRISAASEFVDVDGSRRELTLVFDLPLDAIPPRINGALKFTITLVEEAERMD